MTLTPLRLSEAGSLAKASTPEPFSTSKTSNWVARKGGLPPYVQHIAHDLMEKGGKTESEAIRLAIGIVKNPPASWGPEAKAAAKKAAAEWEAKKGVSSPGSAAKSVARKVAESLNLADRVALRRAARSRLEAVEEAYGVAAMGQLIEAQAVANPDSYSGPTTMTEYPTESSARYAAGLPEQPTSVEKKAQVVALGEMIAFDLTTLDLLGEELPVGLGPLAEGGFSRVFDEAKHPRGYHGRFTVGDRVNFQHSHFGRVSARVTKVDSRRVHLSSPDPRVHDTSMTHKQAETKLSVTTKPGYRAGDHVQYKHPNGQGSTFGRIDRMSAGKAVIKSLNGPTHVVSISDIAGRAKPKAKSKVHKQAETRLSTTAQAAARASKGPGSSRRYEKPADVAEVHSVLDKLKPGDSMSLGKISKVSVLHEGGKYHVKHGGTSLPFGSSKSAATHALTLHRRALDKKVRESASVGVLGSLLEGEARRAG